MQAITVLSFKDLTLVLTATEENPMLSFSHTQTHTQCTPTQTKSNTICICIQVLTTLTSKCQPSSPNTANLSSRKQQGRELPSYSGVGGYLHMLGWSLLGLASWCMPQHLDLAVMWPSPRCLLTTLFTTTADWMLSALAQVRDCILTSCQPHRAGHLWTITLNPSHTGSPVDNQTEPQPHRVTCGQSHWTPATQGHLWTITLNHSNTGSPVDNHNEPQPHRVTCGQSDWTPATEGHLWTIKPSCTGSPGDNQTQPHRVTCGQSHWNPALSCFTFRLSLILVQVAHLSPVSLVTGW